MRTMNGLLFVVERSRSDVYQSLKRGCSQVNNMHVIWDRRHSGRGESTTLVDTERRRVERRVQKVDEELSSLGFAAVKPVSPRPSQSSPSPKVEDGPTPSDARSFLIRVPLFRELSLDELAVLAKPLKVRSLRNGEVLFREGDRGDQMFVVYQGRIVLSKEVVGRVEQVLTTMSPGDFFGEMGLFGGLRRSATATAQTDTVVWELDRDSLQHLVDRSGRAGVTFFAAMVREFSKRLDRTDDLVAEVTRWGLEATGLPEGLER